MQLRFEIPEGFWSLFRSVNRETYIEALMAINEEYQYSNYFLTREVCIQVLRDLYMKKQIELKREEDETEFDMLETPSARILNWLIRKGWLKKIEDYNTLVTNIVIPDYAAVFVDAFVFDCGKPFGTFGASATNCRLWCNTSTWTYHICADSVQ